MPPSSSPMFTLTCGMLGMPSSKLTLLCKLQMFQIIWGGKPCLMRCASKALVCLSYTAVSSQRKEEIEGKGR